ncbi:MAG: S49 family peptidase [Hyphomicrobiales bacterium]|nr:S49 family peptidase [Hyphomicrobiales bacterium]
MSWFRRAAVLPVLQLSGVIGAASPLRSGLTLASTAGAIERAFTMSKLPGVAVVINSPGGSPVQSHLIFRRIRALAQERRKRVHVFCEDVAASGGYFLALAGDEIYADPSTVVGSIGVISAGFGLEKAIDKLGITRRVHTAGANKGALDPFLPEQPEQIARLTAIQREIHDAFIAIVKDRRAGRLKGPDSELFSGAFWSARQALDLGLIDGLDDVLSRMRATYGERVRLVPVALARPGLLSRLRRLPGLMPIGSGTDGSEAGYSLAEDALGAIEARAMWGRYGL